jgi:2-keto-4-pentenoate hydratase/2-oxohepta-3-ene-1,7-dioic acid hydratase in catechol pathway
MQNGSTANLIFNIPHLVSYVSKFMSLLAGTLFLQVRTAGVGLGFKPPVYLKPGDVMELGIEGLGTSTQKCVAYAKN